MTIIEMQMRVREHQQQILREVEHQHLLRSLFPRQSLRAQLAAALFWLGGKLDPSRALLRTCVADRALASSTTPSACGCTS